MSGCFLSRRTMSNNKVKVYFPIQNLEKIRSNTLSISLAPASSSSAYNALRISSPANSGLLFRQLIALVVDKKNVRNTIFMSDAS